MATLTGCFFDTSVLVGGTIDLGERTQAAQAALSAALDGRVQGPMTAWHCCLEYYSVLTRLPRELRVPPKVARRLLAEQVLGPFRVGALPDRDRTSFLNVLTADQVKGGRVYDYQIAHVARSMGASTVITDNRRHFTGLMRHGIRVLTAADFVAGL